MSKASEPLTKKQRRRLSCILMPSLSGKTTLSKTLNEFKGKSGTDYTFLDLDTFMALKLKGDEMTLKAIKENPQLKELYLYPLVKEELLNLLKMFSKKIIVILVSSETLIEFLHIKPKRIKSYVPSNQLWQGIKSKLTKENTETTDTTSSSTPVSIQFDLFDQLRENIIKSFGSNIQVYEDFDQLKTKIISEFSLIRKV
jgi:hypothetical protein